jgi:NADP-reducing hydrogenase subunit HndC
MSIGSMMGSGGLIVLDDSNCMVDIALFFLDFTVEESCGKCTPCRVGTKRLYEILERISRGQGEPEDINRIKELGQHIKASSLCGLGQTAPNPALSTLEFFRDEYEAHIREKRCPAGVCKDLLVYEIIAGKCVGCTVCKKACPVDAIAGIVKETHVINKKACIKCGACVEKCKFNAIVKR